MENNSPSTGFSLSGFPQELHEAFGRRDAKLARIYFGAKHVLSQTDNPDREALACHNFRELLDLMHIAFKEAEIPGDPPDLNGVVGTLRGIWEKVEKNSTCYKDDFTSEVDTVMKGFLNKLKSEFEKMKETRPSRKKRRKEIIKHLDPQQGELPESIEKLRITEWEVYEKYFSGGAHHKDVEKMEQMVIALENYLLNFLNPRTAQDHQEIKAIIQEGESAT